MNFFQIVMFAGAGIAVMAGGTLSLLLLFRMVKIARRERIALARRLGYHPRPRDVKRIVEGPTFDD